MIPGMANPAIRPDSPVAGDITTSQYSSVLGAPSETVTATTYTVTATDYRTTKLFSAAAGCAVTLPAASAEVVAPGFWCVLVPTGGPVALTVTSLTVKGDGNLHADAGDVIYVEKLATADNWLVEVRKGGSLNAVTTGAAVTLTAARFHDLTIDENTTVTLPVVSAPAVIFVRATGDFTLGFVCAGSVLWNGGTIPTYATPSAYMFLNPDGGDDWVGLELGLGLDV